MTEAFITFANLSLYHSSTLTGASRGRFLGRRSWLTSSSSVSLSLDLHYTSADGNGNPIGGLVFHNGVQVHEWTSFVSQKALRRLGKGSLTLIPSKDVGF